MDYILRRHVWLATIALTLTNRYLQHHMGVNVTEVSSCQYDILQNQNKTKHNLTIGNVKM